jgi:preprotein translocase subunit SecE
MARDRRRAKQRRERQARASGGGKARRVEGDGAAAPPHEHDAERLHEHEPAELASGENDIAEAQLALGRPDLVDATAPEARELRGAAGEAEVEGDEATFEALEDRVDEAEAIFEGRSPENGHAERGEEVVRERTAVAAPREREGNKLANFLRGSWRELQRVQWPDRRQVGQATAVVIGFVFVAGAFLGLMDYVASKIVEFIV